MRNVEEGGWTQGDLDHTVEELSLKNAALNHFQKWPSGVVHYTLDHSYSARDRTVIMKAMEQFHRHTCIKFVELKSNNESIACINFVNDGGCSSYVGFDGQPHVTRLHSPGCLMLPGTVIHELMHTLGFHHEHTRTDRDDFVVITWANVAKGHERNFEKQTDGDADLLQLGLPYDYDSVMHYTANAFSRNWFLPTLVPLFADSSVLGQRLGLSRLDVARVNRLYNCTNHY